MSDIKVGIIGCGAIAPKHVEAIRVTPGLELVAACDIIPERAEALGVETFRPSQLNRMLLGGYVDLVAICTPNHLHWEMARKAASAGLDVIVEKPAAIGVPDLRERSIAAHVFPVLQVRENAAVQAFFASIPYLGKLRSCSLVQRWSRDQAYYDAAPWRGSVAEAGGSLYTQGIHYIDVMVQALGPVSEVDARMATLGHDIEVEDELVATFRLESGVFGTLHFSLNEGKSQTVCLLVIGERGRVAIGGEAMNEIYDWRVPGLARPELEAEDPNSYSGAYVGSPANHGAIYRNVADHLLRGKPIKHSLESAVPALDFVEKAYKAARRERCCG